VERDGPGSTLPPATKATSYSSAYVDRLSASPSVSPPL